MKEPESQQNLKNSFKNMIGYNINSNKPIMGRASQQ